MDLNKRMMLFVVLSLAILLGFSYFIPKPKQTIDANQTKINQVATKNVHSSNAIQNKTPQKAPKAPQTTSHTIATVKTKKYTLKIDNLGRIDSVILKEKKYRDKNGNPINLINKNLIKPLELRFKDSKLNDLAFQTPYSASSLKLNATSKSAQITLTQKLGNITIEKIITFFPEGNYKVTIKAPKEIQYFITPGFRPLVDKTRYLVVRGALIRDNKGIITTIEDKKAKEIQNFSNLTVAAAIDRYYTTLLYKKSGTFSATVGPMGLPNHQNDPIIFIPLQGENTFQAYIGPKEWELFSKLDPKLTDVIEFGWFTFLAKPFFKTMLAIYHFVGNWGWAIVLFTILVKIVLFPLSYKGLMSMQKLKDLAPKMQEIREKYAKDPAKMNQQMMLLYKKHGTNPMGGCLPMLLQIPIFFALYRVLLNADELQGAPWILWIHDLSRQDPYFILPILMGATMYLQQKLTPNTMTDPMQKRIFQFFPVIMTLFFITFPSGLVLYWLVNNILSIAQQVYVNKAYEKYKQTQKAKK